MKIKENILKIYKWLIKDGDQSKYGRFVRRYNPESKITWEVTKAQIIFSTKLYFLPLTLLWRKGKKWILTKAKKIKSIIRR